MLLHGAGKLEAVGLSCAMCAKDDARKRALGCMAPPVIKIHDEHGAQVDAEWSEAALEDYAKRLGVEPTAEFASSWMYGQANLHEISAYLPGELWACCPRSYAEFSSAKAQRVASQIIEAARDIIHEMPSPWVLGGNRPTGKTKQLVRMALAFLRNQQAEALRDG